jgi:hypothetical protein
MRRTALLLSFLMVVPALSLAQRGGGSRSRATSRTDMFPDEQAQRRVTTVSSSKLRDLDPLTILLDKHKDLSLTDDQMAKLKTMDGQLAEMQQPAYHVLDSLDQQLANLGSHPSSDDQARMQTTSAFTHMIAGNVRQQYDSVEKVAGALLTDDQKKKADDVLKDSHNQMAKLAERGRRGN